MSCVSLLMKGKEGMTTRADLNAVRDAASEAQQQAEHNLAAAQQQLRDACAEQQRAACSYGAQPTASHGKASLAADGAVTLARRRLDWCESAQKRDNEQLHAATARLVSVDAARCLYQGGAMSDLPLQVLVTLSQRPASTAWHHWEPQRDGAGRAVVIDTEQRETLDDVVAAVTQLDPACLALVHGLGEPAAGRLRCRIIVPTSRGATAAELALATEQLCAAIGVEARNGYDGKPLHVPLAPRGQNRTRDGVQLLKAKPLDIDELLARHQARPKRRTAHHPQEARP